MIEMKRLRRGSVCQVSASTYDRWFITRPLPAAYFKPKLWTPSFPLVCTRRDTNKKKHKNLGEIARYVAFGRLSLTYKCTDASMLVASLSDPENNIYFCTLRLVDRFFTLWPSTNCFCGRKTNSREKETIRHRLAVTGHAYAASSNVSIFTEKY